MKKTLFVVAALLLLGALIWWVAQSPQPTTHYKQIDLVEANDIINTTELNYLDTVVHVGMNELDLMGVKVLIQPMSDRIRNQFETAEGMELEAYVAEWMDGYTICVNPNLGHERAIEVMSHELIHLQQYHSKDLVVGDDTIVLWMGQRYDVLGLPYSDRPWERAAFSSQRELANRIRKQILE